MVREGARRSGRAGTADTVVAEQEWQQPGGKRSALLALRRHDPAPLGQTGAGLLIISLRLTLGRYPGCAVVAKQVRVS